MKVSGFTFIRNAQVLGYPFVQSIKSVLPIVDEFIVALGPCEDETENMIKDIGDAKIRIIHTQWNENMRTDVRLKGFVYGQQKSIALFNCTGDWAFYLESDEVIHEDDLPVIRASMEKYLNDNRVEALVFDYIHFYGNRNTFAWSPGWYRKAPRILRNNIPSWAPKGLFFIVMENHKKGRYPRAALTGVNIYHYGWVRSEEQMRLKTQKVEKYWSDKGSSEVKYADIDSAILREFKGNHPAVIKDWLPEAEGIFKAAPTYRLSQREIKHRMALWLERVLGVELSKKHFRLVR
ncbi:MAG: glycosyltransferase [Nitrospirae bacterium]|nr:glycosyltransferase [Nitrospirota bacterium]